MDWINNSRLHTLFSALDDALGEESSSVSLVVVGGAAMMLGGWVERTTQDIDVIAISEQHGSTEILQSAAQFPEGIQLLLRK